MLFLGMRYLKMLVEDREADGALLVLARLLANMESRNPVHAGLTSRVAALGDHGILMPAHQPRGVHSPQSGRGSVDGAAENQAEVAAHTLQGTASRGTDSSSPSKYRMWCASCVAAGELNVIRHALAALAELTASSTDASDFSANESSQSDADDTTSRKRSKLHA